MSDSKDQDLNPKEIERSAEEILRVFTRVIESLPVEEETYYGQELVNPLRPDGEPSPPSVRREFRKCFISIMPASDDDGKLRVEVARWAR